MSLLIYAIVFLLGTKIAWNFYKVYYLLWYLLRHKTLYPSGVLVYFFVEWILLLLLVIGFCVIDQRALNSVWTSVFFIVAIICSYANGWIVLNIMRMVDAKFQSNRN